MKRITPVALALIAIPLGSTTTIAQQGADHGILAAAAAFVREEFLPDGPVTFDPRAICWDEPCGQSVAATRWNRRSDAANEVLGSALGDARQGHLDESYTCRDARLVCRISDGSLSMVAFSAPRGESGGSILIKATIAVQIDENRIHARDTILVLRRVDGEWAVVEERLQRIS